MARTHSFWRAGSIGLLMLFAVPACQVKQEVLPKPLAVDPNKPVNPAGIAADSPAHLCSAETRLYLQFDDMARWRAARTQDPLIEYLWNGIEEIRPKGMWEEAAKNLGVDEQALIDRYFGSCLAIIGEGVNTTTPYAIISRVSANDLRSMPEMLGLKPMPDVGPRAASSFAPSFAKFSSHDDQLLLAMHDQWLIAAPVKHRDHFESAVAFAETRVRKAVGPAVDIDSLPLLSLVPTEPSLVEDDQFQNLAMKLPGARTLFFYTRDRSRKGRHAASVVMEGSQLVANYAGTIDRMDDLYRQFAHGEQIDFGFIPQSTISAASVNLMKKDAKGLKALNLFLFPKNVEDHVLPKLAAPMLVFLGKVDGEKIEPNPGVSVPAVGMAIRMKDPTVVHELNRIVGGIHFMANVGQLDLIEGVFGGKTIKADGLEYRKADFGDALMKEIRDPESARMFRLPDAAGLTQLTYGRIGSWFLICSQESLYKECAAAHDDESLRFTSSPKYDAFPFAMREGLVMSALTRAPELAALTQELNRYWETMEAKARAQAPAEAAKPPVNDEGAEEKVSGAKKIRQPMEWIANAIKHRDSFSLQVWRDGDGDLRGHLRTVEPAPMTAEAAAR